MYLWANNQAQIEKVLNNYQEKFGDELFAPCSIQNPPVKICPYAISTLRDELKVADNDKSTCPDKVGSDHWAICRLFNYRHFAGPLLTQLIEVGKTLTEYDEIICVFRSLRSLIPDHCGHPCQQLVTQALS
jgi:hypothetical protein